MIGFPQIPAKVAADESWAADPLGRGRQQQAHIPPEQGLNGTGKEPGTPGDEECSCNDELGEPTMM